ncbi:MAG: hypothetical protein CM1200mP41_18440 [Gammaproteobacteria bacterium]|nr:MAG: hypothetical protein CM1200mP41_18440 [Gammaproteobacteria bacterium]
MPVIRLAVALAPKYEVVPLMQGLAARLVTLRRDVSLEKNLKAFRFDPHRVGNE